MTNMFVMYSKIMKDRYFVTMEDVKEKFVTLSKSFQITDEDVKKLQIDLAKLLKLLRDYNWIIQEESGENERKRNARKSVRAKRSTSPTTNRPDSNNKTSANSKKESAVRGTRATASATRKRKNEDAKKEYVSKKRKTKGATPTTKGVPIKTEKKPTSKRKGGRRKVGTRPTTPTQMKDETTQRVFRSTVEKLKKLQILMTPKEERKRKYFPKVQPFMFLYDEMETKPHTIRDSVFHRIAPELSILAPDGVDMKDLGVKLVKLGKALQEERVDDDTVNYNYTEDSNELIKKVFGSTLEKFEDNDDNDDGSSDDDDDDDDDDNDDDDDDDKDNGSELNGSNIHMF